MGRIYMPWKNLKKETKEIISSGLIRNMKMERELYGFAISDFNEYETSKEIIKKNDNNDNVSNKNVLKFENEFSTHVNDNDNKETKNSVINNKKTNNINDNNYEGNNKINDVGNKLKNKNKMNLINDITLSEKLLHSKNRYIRHSRECLSALCKLGVTYESISVHLLHEILSVSTDLLEMYVHSVDDKENKNHLKENDARNIDDGNENLAGASTASTVKLIPPVIMSAATLHWLAIMKIPYKNFQPKVKNTVLNYLETVLFHSTSTGKKEISFSFLISVLTNLDILELKWSDLSLSAKNRFINFTKYIQNSKNDKKTNEKFIKNEIDNNSLFKTNLMKYENLLLKMGFPNIEKLLVEKTNDELSTKSYIAININTQNLDKNVVENEKVLEIKRNPIQIENDNSKFLSKLSLKISVLPDADFLRAVFLLGQKKIRLGKLKQAGHSNSENEMKIESSEKANTDENKNENGNIILKEVKEEKLVGKEVMHSSSLSLSSSIESVRVKENLLNVLDTRLEKILFDISPG